MKHLKRFSLVGGITGGIGLMATLSTTSTGELLLESLQLATKKALEESTKDVQLSTPSERIVAAFQRPFPEHIHEVVETANINRQQQLYDQGISKFRRAEERMIFDRQIRFEHAKADNVSEQHWDYYILPNEKDLYREYLVDKQIILLPEERNQLRQDIWAEKIKEGYRSKKFPIMPIETNISTPPLEILNSFSGITPSTTLLTSSPKTFASFSLSEIDNNANSELLLLKPDIKIKPVLLEPLIEDNLIRKGKEPIIQEVHDEKITESKSNLQQLQTLQEKISESKNAYAVTKLQSEVILKEYNEKCQIFENIPELPLPEFISSYEEDMARYHRMRQKAESSAKHLKAIAQENLQKIEALQEDCKKTAKEWQTKAKEIKTDSASIRKMLQQCIIRMEKMYEDIRQSYETYCKRHKIVTYIQYSLLAGAAYGACLYWGINPVKQLLPLFKWFFKNNNFTSAEPTIPIPNITVNLPNVAPAVQQVAPNNNDTLLGVVSGFALGLLRRGKGAPSIIRRLRR